MEIYTWHHKEVYILLVESKRSLSMTNAMYKKFRQIKDVKIYHKSDASAFNLPKKFVKMLLRFFLAFSSMLLSYGSWKKFVKSRKTHWKVTSRKTWLFHNLFGLCLFWILIFVLISKSKGARITKAENRHSKSAEGFWVFLSSKLSIVNRGWERLKTQY